MQSIGRRYLQYINKQYRRTGTLWESRHKSSLVDEDNYLLKCMHYIELNPVRAKAYRSLFENELDQADINMIRNAALLSMLTGNNRFKEQIEKASVCTARKAI